MDLRRRGGADVVQDFLQDGGAGLAVGEGLVREAHAVEDHVLGEGEKSSEGENILFAAQRALRDWTPPAFSSHTLVNLVFQFQDVAPTEGGLRYAGLQRWRAVTEEL